MKRDSLWYKDAVIYQLHVRAFCDANGDGIGDFRGLAEKLEYLQDLGVTALWLLPFYPSPLRDDGYDIADYRGIHANYGSLADFRALLREAHRRGLRVITELVINHTSDQHKWFQAARQAPPGSSKRNFYVWSDDPSRYSEARIIFRDFEGSNWSWDPVAKAYYWHRFYSHQPDLNFDNPAVRRAVLRILNFWLRMGVDGLRLDAVPYLYEREGTNCENLPETHAVLKELREFVDEHFEDRMLLAEANQWPEDAVTYFGDGDECHMAFHFPVMPRLYMALSMEDRFPIIDILDQTPALPPTCQWALFLRNHDELTLEMVTDEERDYMYRAYANDPQMRINLGIRRRLAPLLGNNRRKIELLNALLFSLPGTPVIYYGDEIGMGDNVFLGDRDGVRTPFQWSPDRNAGFSRANPQQLYLPVVVDPEYHYETVNVENQRSNPQSLFWWLKRLVALRQRFRAFGRGELTFLHPDNRYVLAYTRRYDDECILVVANLSRFVQCVELDLKDLQGMVPVELFGRTAFPVIGDRPYFLSLGPHAFYWFSIEPVRAEDLVTELPKEQIPELVVPEPWTDLFRGRRVHAIERTIAQYLPRCRWFGGKGRKIGRVSVVDVVPLPADGSEALLTVIDVEYTGETRETFVLPLALALDDRAQRLQENTSAAVVARVAMPGGDGGARPAVLYDALVDEPFAHQLLTTMLRKRRFRGRSGMIVAETTRALRGRLTRSEPLPPAQVLALEQSNTSVVFGDRVIMKVFRRLEEGINPDLEIGEFLTKQTRFGNAPPVVGALHYRPPRGEARSLAVFHGYVQNEGNAWGYTLSHLREYFERALALPEEGAAVPPVGSLLELAESDVPASARELVGYYLDSAALLGTRTAEMHAALSSDVTNEAFRPESLAALDRRSLYQSMRTLASRVFQDLRKRANRLPDNAREHAQAVLEGEGEILRRFRSVVERRVSGKRIRCHGDYHLGQVLYTGKDFFIIDFEGEPARPISERRLKRPAMRDVAGMLRSFHYAAETALWQAQDTGTISPEKLPVGEQYAYIWYIWVSTVFLKTYLEGAAGTAFIPPTPAETDILLHVHLLEKALYETHYEINNRPHWVHIPLRGLAGLLDTVELAS